MAIVQAVGPKVLRPSQYGLDTPVGEIERQGRLTVAFAMVYKCEQMLLVKPTEGQHCILPQGGVKSSVDETLFDTFYREARKEIRYQQTCFKRGGEPTLLGEFLNPLPPGRRRGGEEVKHTFVVAVPVWHSDWVQLNDENRKCFWVGEREFLAHIAPMEKNRPVKFQAMKDAVVAMVQRNLLSWPLGGVTA